MTPGARLGPYEIVAPLGAGGMGEVYRARDPRSTARSPIKVLPPRLASDEAARARFEREARAVAALSHPNILAIHDFGQQDGVVYAVTELLDGETLRERSSAGRAADAQGRADRRRDRRRPRRRPRQGHRPPRPQAGERVRHCATAT